MTPFQWLETVQGVVTVLALVLLWGLKTAIASGRWFNHTTEIEAQQTARIDDLARRLDRAGAKMSDLATEVQSCPERCRKEYMPLTDALTNWQRYREDHQDLEHRVRELELIVARVQAGWRGGGREEP
jgi:cell division protein FtsB